MQPVRLKLLVGHHAIALAKDMLGLAVIELVVARDNGSDRLALGVDQRQRLARTVLGEAEKLGDGLDGAHTRSLDLGKRAVAGALGHNDLGACSLVIGSKAAIVAVDERGPPASARAMYSTEVSPPISPESATTGRALM